MVRRLLQEIKVNNHALVVGSGVWATKVSRRLSENFGFQIHQVSARALVNDELEENLEKKYQLIVCATTPVLQEQVIANYSHLSNHIWLEKPLANSYEGAKEILSSLEKQNDISALVNFSWTFSEIWRSFEMLNLIPEQVKQIQISRAAFAESHKYINAKEDYGSHDIALLLYWFITRRKSEVEVVSKKFESHSFQTQMNGIPVKWSINFGASIKSMVWTIKWNDGKITKIDFYRNRIDHEGRTIEVKGPDNIENLLRVLFNDDRNVQEYNRLIALKTKEFFSI
jgi:predicted dehydrogenase